MRHVRRCSLLCLWCAAVLSLASPTWSQVKAEAAKIVRQGKLATVMVDRGVEGTGSAFCISDKGFFITNHHVIKSNRLAFNNPIKLIVQSGEKEQRILEARVVKFDERTDLALLHVENPGNLTPLALGSDANLVETAHVTAFGYPLGKMLTIDQRSYPSITVSTGRITALRKDKGELAAIQIDAQVNPGNSGGPLVDEAGKVIGVIVSGVVGTGLNFAIPVSHLRSFLDTPGVGITLPEVEFKNRRLPKRIRVDVHQFEKPKEAMTVELSIPRPWAADAKPLILRERLTGTRVEFNALLMPTATGPEPLQLGARFEDRQTVYGDAEDVEIRVGDVALRLLEVAQLERIDEAGTTYRVRTFDRRQLTGKLTGLPATILVAGKAQPMTLPRLVSVFAHQPEPAELSFQIRLLAGEKELVVHKATVAVQHVPPKARTVEVARIPPPKVDPVIPKPLPQPEVKPVVPVPVVPPVPTVPRVPPVPPVLDPALNAAMFTLIASGDEKAQQRQWSEAIGAFQLALKKAQDDQSPFVEDVKARLDEAMRCQTTAQKIAKLREATERGDATAADEWFRLSLLHPDLHEPGQPPMGHLKNDQLRLIVEDSNRELPKLGAQTCASLGIWYSKAGLAENNEGALRKARAYLTRALILLGEGEPGSRELEANLKATQTALAGVDRKASIARQRLPIGTRHYFPLDQWSVAFKDGASSALDQVDGLDATLLGTRRVSSGARGQALTFLSNDDRIEMDRNSLPKKISAVSVAAWINVSKLVERGPIVDAHDWLGHPASNGFALRMEKSKLEFYVAGKGRWVVAPLQKKPTMQEWMHLVGTFDSKHVALYLNGELVASTPADGAIDASTLKLAIGNGAYGHWRGNAWPGEIDDVLIIDRAITAPEVKALFTRRVSTP